MSDTPNTPERPNPFTGQATPSRAPGCVYDRFGREVGAGDTVLLTQQGTILWRVVSTRPVFAPNVPPGVVELVMIAQFATGIPGGQPIGDLIKVQHGELPPELVAAAQQTPVDLAAPPAGAPPAPPLGPRRVEP